MSETRNDSETPKDETPEVKTAFHSPNDENFDPSMTSEQKRRHQQPYSQIPTHRYCYPSIYSPSPPFYPPYYSGGTTYSSSFGYYPNSAPSSNFIAGAVPGYEQQHQRYEWPISRVEYITEVNPNDVLSGRGGATNAHNRAFRATIKKYQNDYLKAKKRDKPKVAVSIVHKIREQGGRFLRRHHVTAQGKVVWVDIGDTRACEKVCQALREGAPDLRRQKQVDASAKSNDNDDQKCRDSDGTLSAVSTLDRTVSEGDEGYSSGKTQILRSSFQKEKEDATSANGSIVIRPSPNLIRKSSSSLKDVAIPVDDLDPRDREVYLRYFLPPNPAIRKKKLNAQAVLAPDAMAYDNVGSSSDASVQIDWATTKFPV